VVLTEVDRREIAGAQVFFDFHDDDFLENFIEEGLEGRTEPLRYSLFGRIETSGGFDAEGEVIVGGRSVRALRDEFGEQLAGMDFAGFAADEVRFSGEIFNALPGDEGFSNRQDGRYVGIIRLRAFFLCFFA